MSSCLGHWVNNSTVSDENISKFAAFTYIVVFEDNYFYIGFKAIRNRISGKKLSWKNYKTSSKLVKAKLLNTPADFIIVGVHSSQEEAIEEEQRLLRSVDALKNELCLNQAISHREMLRRPESYTEEAVNNAKRGLERYRNSEAYTHPMQGKQHPNRGKKLPQTAPKRHVSKDNIQITDGVTNKWWPKGKELPEGFYRGLTTKPKRVTAATLKQLAINTAINTINARIRYSLNPSCCKVCNTALSYADKNNSLCGEESCFRTRRKQIGAKNVGKKYPGNSAKARSKYAKKKGFDSYYALAEAVWRELESSTYTECQIKFDMARGTVYNLKRWFELNQ